MTKDTHRWITGGLIAAWFTLSLSLSAVGAFHSNNQFGLPVAFAAGVPMILFFVWYAASAGFREFVLSLDPRILTIVQTWRIEGAVFVVLYGFGLLPGIFALPAGLGDVTIGLTAPLVVWNLVRNERRSAFVVWQALGMLDLVTAVTLGTTAQLINPNGVSIAPMTVLPLSMIPTFFVPLLLIFHVLSVAQARRWPEGGYSRWGEPLGSTAA